MQQSTVTSADGTTIATYTTGSGPLVVQVDGALAHWSSNPAAAAVAGMLASDFTVVNYDRRGRGGSGDTAPYDPQREVDDLAAVVAGAGGGPALVSAGSSGCALALDAAAAGVPIAGLALYEPPFIVDDSRPPLPDDYVERLDRLVAEGRPGDAVELFMTAAVGIPAEFVGGMRHDPSWAELEKVAGTIAYDGRFVADCMAGRPLPAGRWASVAVPTLVVDGGASPTFMHTGADAVAAAVPGARRATLPDQTHDVSPEVVVPVLREFFRSVAG